MCGIALIISGARIDSSSVSQQSCLHGESRLSTAPETERMRELVFSLDDLKAALLRRGPDRLGCKKVFLQADRANSVKKELSIALSNGDPGPKERRAILGFCSADTKIFTELEFLGAVLQLRGICPVLQPLVDTFGNILVFNGQMLMDDHPTLFWTPCAAHCIDLMLHDICKLPIITTTVKRAIALNGYIYNHPYVLNMMRTFTEQKELIRPGVTRFATVFLTLQSIYNQKNKLRRMFTSEEWSTSRYHRDTKGKDAYETVLSPGFWNNILYSLRATGPLVRVLRMVDSEKKPAMGYIYEAMDRAKEAISKSFNYNEAKYYEIWEIIDKRWNDQLHRPLHAAGYYLNPEYFYTTPRIESNEELNDGFLKTMARLVPDEAIQHLVETELSLYRYARGVMGSPNAIRNRALWSPGEIFGGIDVQSDTNDAEILIHALGRCCTCEGHGHKTSCYCDKKVEISIPELLSTIKGPWALVYWQAASKTIWFGRDAFGRRSLLVHWPTIEDPRFILSSVSPSSSVRQNSGFETEDGITNYWEELSCGLYTISFDDLKAESLYKQHDLVGEVRKHEWTDTLLKKLIQWERTCVEPNSQEHSSSLMNQIGTTEHFTPAHKVLIVLRESVMRRIIINKNNLCENGQKFVPVAVLFSGGLDSMILAALLDQCLNSRYDIDLLNVSFDGQLAPDRISAKAGLHELQKIAPSRRWRLVEIDANLSDLTLEVKHVMSLINPANTYMDLNIGIALWLAAGGDGWVDEGLCDSLEQDFPRCKYKSKAVVLLVGSGADEQCAGYSRYRTKYKQGSWNALEEEMKLDMQRIWKRNLGRDDRCISDNGKEARFPFLDEDVIRTLLEIPLWDIADLDQPIGRGDKKILREVARLLGLEAAAAMPKRAIQFGSRIARESNRMNFGSNRAANQASAGSVVIRGPAD